MRNLFNVNEELKVIELFDERWYQIPKDGQILDVAGVTTFLEVYPKGYAFRQWLKSVGFNAEEILRTAGEFGSRFHDLIQRTLKGETVTYDEHKDIELWKRFMVWVDFWKDLNKKYKVNYEPNWIETIIYNIDNIPYAGRRDFRMKVDDKNIIIDWKSGNYIGEEANLQLAAYSIAEEKMIQENIDEAWICWFPAKAPNKAKYRVIKRTREQLKIDFEDFVHVQKIWMREHATETPRYKTVPLTVNIKDIGVEHGKSTS